MIIGSNRLDYTVDSRPKTTSSGRGGNVTSGANLSIKSKIAFTMLIKLHPLNNNSSAVCVMNGVSPDAMRNL